MAEVHLVRTGQTAWEAQGRVDSAAGTPLTDQGVRDVRAVAAQLAGQRIAAIYAGDGEGEAQTADLLAAALRLKVRTIEDLRELDYGLWQGLTMEEIKRRQPKVYRQWLDRPSSVQPPGGETLEEAASRLRSALEAIVKRHKDQAAVLVLRPAAMGLLRCMLQGEPTDSLWKNVDRNCSWKSYRTDGTGL